MRAPKVHQLTTHAQHPCQFNFRPCPWAMTRTAACSPAATRRPPPGRCSKRPDGSCSGRAPVILQFFKTDRFGCAPVILARTYTGFTGGAGGQAHVPDRDYWFGILVTCVSTLAWARRWGGTVAGPGLQSGAEGSGKIRDNCAEVPGIWKT
eukprot:gene15874-biopygen3717